jgi:hypothetical protein
MKGPASREAATLNEITVRRGRPPKTDPPRYQELRVPLEHWLYAVVCEYSNETGIPRTHITRVALVEYLRKVGKIE